MFHTARKLSGLLMLLSLNAMALEVGDFAPCVVLKDIQPNGTSINQCIRTRAKKTQPYVVIDFSIPKCEDCNLNMPVVAALAPEIEKTATTRVVLSSMNSTDIDNFLKEHKVDLTIPVSLDTQVNAAQAYGVTAAPTVFVLDKKNNVIFKHVGVLSKAETDQIKTLVAAE